MNDLCDSGEPVTEYSAGGGDADLQHTMLDKVRALLDADALPSTYLRVLSDWSLIIYPNMENGSKNPYYMRDVNRMDAIDVQYNPGAATPADPARFIVALNGSMSIGWSTTPEHAAERVRDVLARAAAQRSLSDSGAPAPGHGTPAAQP